MAQPSAYWEGRVLPAYSELQGPGLDTELLHPLQEHADGAPQGSEVVDELRVELEQLRARLGRQEQELEAAGMAQHALDRAVYCGAMFLMRLAVEAIFGTGIRESVLRALMFACAVTTIRHYHCQLPKFAGSTKALTASIVVATMVVDGYVACMLHH